MIVSLVGLRGVEEEGTYIFSVNVLYLQLGAIKRGSGERGRHVSWARGCVRISSTQELSGRVSIPFCRQGN